MMYPAPTLPQCKLPNKMAKTGRKRGKRNSRGKAVASGNTSPTFEAPPVQDVADILGQARSAGDPFHAVTLYKKALRVAPEDTIVLGEAAELLLQVGETSTAKEVLARSILLAPAEGPDKYLNMAQLHEGREALEFYQKGLDIMQRQLGADDKELKGQDAALKQRLCMTFCSVGELFLTDLCFEEDAEKRCQDALDKSMMYDYGGPEPPHAVANLLLSQGKYEEAMQSAEESFRRLSICEPPPEQEFRVSLAKILLECSATNAVCSEKALEVLGGLMQEDDENVEVWYLTAVAFNSLRPADFESARVHLERAADMLSKIRATQEEMGEEFAYEDQVQLVREQLEVTSRAEGNNGDVRGKESSGTGKSNSKTMSKGEMDCT